MYTTKTGHIKIRILTVRRTFCDRFMWEETSVTDKTVMEYGR